MLAPSKEEYDNAKVLPSIEFIIVRLHDMIRFEPLCNDYSDFTPEEIRRAVKPMITKWTKRTDAKGSSYRVNDFGYEIPNIPIRFNLPNGIYKMRDHSFHLVDTYIEGPARFDDGITTLIYKNGLKVKYIRGNNQDNWLDGLKEGKSVEYSQEHKLYEYNYRGGFLYGDFYITRLGTDGAMPGVNEIIEIKGTINKDCTKVLPSKINTYHLDHQFHINHIDGRPLISKYFVDHSVNGISVEYLYSDLYHGKDIKSIALTRRGLGSVYQENKVIVIEKYFGSKREYSRTEYMKYIGQMIEILDLPEVLSLMVLDYIFDMPRNKPIEDDSQLYNILESVMFGRDILTTDKHFKFPRHSDRGPEYFEYLCPLNKRRHTLLIQLFKWSKPFEFIVNSWSDVLTEITKFFNYNLCNDEDKRFYHLYKYSSKYLLDNTNEIKVSQLCNTFGKFVYLEYTNKIVLYDPEYIV